MTQPGPIKTTCPYCGVGCGVDASFDGQKWHVKGDPDHPANFGRLCSKGSALGETIGLDGRLLTPSVDGEQTDWATAITAVADRLSAVIEQYGPNAVALYGSGQLLTEDYYVANKLMKGFIGTANMDTNSRLCMSSTVAGHKRGLGSDTVPGLYEDLELADMVVLTGSNLAWCHPVLYQRLVAARESHGTRIVVIDPRRTDSCDSADLHLAIKPGTDVTLFHGLLAYLHQNDAVDTAYMNNHVENSEQTLKNAIQTAGNLSQVAAVCDVSLKDLATFYDLFLKTEKTVTVFSQGVNQSVNGTDKVNSILNVHLATGRIGKPGLGPFSVTGQPNAMGGREVGGLANMLAAHMDFTPETIDRVKRFWDAPNIATEPGMKAIDLYRAMDAGEIKAVWIMATNPAVSLPETKLVRRALSKCPVVIVSDVIHDTDTIKFAHIKLPAAGWSEKNGTVTNSERTISRQRPLRDPLAEAKPDWWILSTVGQALGARLGWPENAFQYTHPVDVFREHAALSAFENNGTRDFDIGALADISRADYDAMTPVRWPYVKGGKPSGRMLADGRFFTPSGKAKMIDAAPGGIPTEASAEFPILLNTGRYRDQWHTMTRTALAPRLNTHRPEPLLEVHPEDANRLNIQGGDIARVRSSIGTYVARVRVDDVQRPGEAFLPMHWTKSHAGHAIIGDVIPGHRDPFSGQPASKAIPVAIEPLSPQWHGVLVTHIPFKFEDLDYWASRKASGCIVTEMADTTDLKHGAVLKHLDAVLNAERLEYADEKRNQHRFAWIADGRVAACLFTGPRRPRLDMGWLEEVAAAEQMDPDTRTQLLAGRAPAGRVDSGPVICSCHQVGLNTILAAIDAQNLTTVDAIGDALAAGTNCGSCIPELRKILTKEDAVEAA